MSESHISGGAEWMHTIGYGYLGEEDGDGTAEKPGRDGRATQPTPAENDDVPTGPSPNTTAGTYSATAASCPHCGQLALVGVGRCACQVAQPEGRE